MEPAISVVIPLMNEEGSLEELFGKIANVLKRMQTSYEIVFIDDGSTDSSFDILKELHQEFPSWKSRSINGRIQIGTGECDRNDGC